RSVRAANEDIGASPHSGSSQSSQATVGNIVVLRNDANDLRIAGNQCFHGLLRIFAVPFAWQLAYELDLRVFLYCRIAPTGSNDIRCISLDTGDADYVAAAELLHDCLAKCFGHSAFGGELLGNGI